MNISSYLPDELVLTLDRLARELGSSRSALIRDALESYLRRFRAGAWPDEVLSWNGDAQYPPFESLRGDEDRPSADPFGASSPL